MSHYTYAITNNFELGVLCSLNAFIYLPVVTVVSVAAPWSALLRVVVGVVTSSCAPQLSTPRQRRSSPRPDGQADRQEYCIYIQVSFLHKPGAGTGPQPAPRSGLYKPPAVNYAAKICNILYLLWFL